MHSHLKFRVLALGAGVDSVTTCVVSNGMVQYLHILSRDPTEAVAGV